MMTENQSISETETMDYTSTHDFLSDLPLNIIHTILGFVPIRDAIKTSVLSRQWRNTWTSLPHLAFEENETSPDHILATKFEKRIENFITLTLNHHIGPIDKFRLSIYFANISPDMDRWIHCLSKSDIKELILDLGVPEFHKSLRLRSCIYFCENLINLELGNCKLDPPPSTFKGFLFLKCLYLRDLGMSCDEIECLVAKCPVLERFDLWGECERSELRISSSSLKYLYVWGSYFELCVSAPLLAEMSISLGYDSVITELEEQNGLVCNYTQFLTGFPKLEKLTGQGYFTKYLSLGIESCQDTLVFDQLKEIELHLVDFKDENSMAIIARLMDGAPNLEKLVIEIDLVNRGHGESELSSVFRSAPDCKFEKLRVVKITYFYGHPCQITFLKFLLQSSPMLETMNIYMLRRLVEDKKQDIILASLRRVSWASKKAKVSFCKSFA